MQTSLLIHEQGTHVLLPTAVSLQSMLQSGRGRLCFAEVMVTNDVPLLHLLSWAAQSAYWNRCDLFLFWCIGGSISDEWKIRAWRYRTEVGAGSADVMGRRICMKRKIGIGNALQTTRERMRKRMQRTVVHTSVAFIVRKAPLQEFFS